MDDLVKRLMDVAVTARNSRFAGPFIEHEAAARIEAQAAMLRECVGALEYYTQYACPICGGDCSAANPPILYCPPQVARTTLTRAKEMLK